MAAIIEPRRTFHAEARPALRLVTTDGRPSAPVAIDLGLRPVHVVAALVALVVVVLGTFAISSGALAALSPAPASPASATAADQTVVVAPGDTLWSIARDLQPSGDVRALVDELLALNGAGPIQPGDRVIVPS